MSTGSSLSVRGLSKSFGAPQLALSSVDLDIRPGEMVALIGASGSGKSTLLRHISGFVAADAGSGEVKVGERTMQSGGRIARDIRHLRTEVGFVFQQFNLVGRLSVMTNVLAGLLTRVPAWRSLVMRFTREEKAEAWRALKSVGIENLAWQRASTLSGGQQQRVAIARALVQRARIILADEPIASLDPESARNVMEILARINREQGITVLVSLHQVQFARRYCVRTVALRLGEVVYDGPSEALDAKLLRNLYGAAVEEMLDGTETIDAVMNDPVVAEGLRPAAASA
ncbi:MAG: phosphonate ABC transporter ATP-binding protein [Betaproteobacteria bacterium]|nr:phosphonate ABC transporter ATP-binding protein [Betaproteobacteria bacterium]